VSPVSLRSAGGSLKLEDLVVEGDFDLEGRDCSGRPGLASIAVEVTPFVVKADHHSLSE
jgi:hypothetical protein